MKKKRATITAAHVELLATALEGATANLTKLAEVLPVMNARINALEARLDVLDGGEISETERPN